MKNVKDLLARLGLLCRLESAMVAVLEEQESRIRKLEENAKLKDAAILKLQKDVGELNVLLRHKVTV